MGKKAGRFIIFEGIDGCGKSTQTQLLRQHLEAQHVSCDTTNEPSAGPIGSMLRQYLSGRMQADERTLAALFAADRLDHLTNETDGILEKIQRGIHVICDRYILSNYAYQSVQVSLDWIMNLNSEAGQIIKPDCHIFIDTAPEICMERMQKNRFHRDLYETEDRLTQVQSRYLSLINKLNESENIIMIDGNQEINVIAEEIWQKISDLFS